MGHCHRAAFFNLTFEQRNNTSVTSQNVSESYRNKLGSLFPVRCGNIIYISSSFVITQSFFCPADVFSKVWQPVCVSTVADGIHALYDHLTETFTCSHNIGRINCFVCTDQYKSLAAVHHCCIGCFIGTDYIVFDCFTWAVLHQRYMLMGCCMVYDLRFIFFEYPVDSLAVTNRTDQNFQIQIRIICFQLLFNVIGVVFINIKNHQKLRLMPCNLPAEFTSDGTASSGYQDSLSLQILKDLRHIYFDSVSPKKIFNCNFFHLT